MATIKSGATSDILTVDPTSKAARATLYDSTGRETSYQSKATFVAAGTFTPPATPTDLVTIAGSLTKTIRVLSFVISTTNTAAGSQAFILVKRSAIDTGGVPVAATMVPYDSSLPAATANVNHWTTSPTGLGGTVGNINVKRVASPVATPATWAGITNDAGAETLPWVGQSILDTPVVLRGNTQLLAINFAGAALVAGQTHAYCVVWTEE